VFEYASATSTNGRDIINTYDYNGDGVVDQIKTTGPTNGTRTEMVINRQGADLATSVLLDRTETVTSANGAQVTIKRDTTGGGWFDEREVQTTNADGSQTQTIDGMLRSSTDNLDGSTGNDRITTTTISETAAGQRTEVVKIEHDEIGTPTNRALESTERW
jgi:hypothetical protein